MDDHPTVPDQPEARQQLGVIQGETAYRVGDGPGQSNSDPGVVRRPASPPSPMQCESSDEQTTLRPTSKRPDTIIRTSQIPKTTGERSKTRLRLNHDLIEAAFGWSDEEYAERRRLIQFWRRQNGPDILLCYKPITANQFIEGTNVVSCIFREETDECYITSVDLIGLLEFLVGNRFSTEEKNRVRRNLEGFKPETMSKTKAFYSLIMGFGEPRPRNIEKDLKVFKWKIVHQAMLKILSKYSYVRSENLANGAQEDDKSVLSSDEFNTRRRGGRLKDQTTAPSTSQSSQAVSTPMGGQFSTPVLTSGTIASSRGPHPLPNRLRNMQIKRDPSLLDSEDQVPNTSGPENTSALALYATHAMTAQAGSQTAPSTLASSQCSTTTSPGLSRELDGPAIMDDRDVNEFLYDATAYMRDPDDGATQATDSPPSFEDTSGELDGINGRSFQHPMQQKMQRERLEADMAARRRRPEVPSTSQFPSHLQQKHVQPPSPHPSPVHYAQHQHQHPQPHVPQVSFSPPVPSPRCESSLAHALDESHIQHTTLSNSPRQLQISWEYPLLYPQQPTPQTLSAHVPRYGDTPVRSPVPIYGDPRVHSPADVSAYASSIKGQHWDENDPNDYLFREPELANHTPFSYDAPASSDPSDWVTLSESVHYPYSYPLDHMQ